MKINKTENLHKHIKGSYKDYDPEVHKNAIYFAEDEEQIIVDGIEYGNSMTGAQGPKGDPGDSAYKVAVLNGFKGTETEWLKSIQGKDGKDGVDGKQGIQGIQGIQGKDGPRGEVGPQGPKGEQGKDGNSPLLRVGDTNKLEVSYNEGEIWRPISDNIAAWFRWQNSTDNLGKVQISRDNNTWENLSPDFINRMLIKGFVSELPKDAEYGDIYMVGPYYNQEDSEYVNPYYRMWVMQDTWVDAGNYNKNTYNYNYNIKKTYLSTSAMNADKSNPIGTNGLVIQIGDIVTVVNSITPSENGYYSYEGSENGWLLQSGFSFEIVQTTGTDVNKAMSQKAVTDEITQLESDVSLLDKILILQRGQILSNSIRQYVPFSVKQNDVVHVVTSNVDLVITDPLTQYYSVSLTKDESLTNLQTIVNNRAVERDVYFVANSDYEYVYLYVFPNTGVVSYDVKLNVIPFEKLKDWILSEAYTVSAMTYDTYGNVKTAELTYPDDTGGVIQNSTSDAEGRLLTMNFTYGKPTIIRLQMTITYSGDLVDTITINKI